MKSYLVIIVSLISLFPSAVSAEEMKFKSEEELANYLTKLSVCEPGIDRVNCAFGFRGLLIEISGGDIFIYKLGARQEITTFGSKCLLISFNDEDLRFLQGKYFEEAGIVFNKNGKISSLTKNNAEVRKECGLTAS